VVEIRLTTIWMSVLILTSLVTPKRTILSSRSILSRGYASPTAAEAYLEQDASRPGIAVLLLNRPKAKNAISRKLLKVHFSCLRPWNLVSDLESAGVPRMSLSCEGGSKVTRYLLM
jgi:hypothetical protein